MSPKVPETYSNSYWGGNVDDTGRAFDNLVESSLCSQVGYRDQLNLAAECGGQCTLDGINLGFLSNNPADTVAGLKGVECRGVAQKSADSSDLSIV